MADTYNPQEIEARWQQKWADDNLYRSVVDPAQPKYYALTMYPYPSGNLHMGHWYSMAPSDARARYMRMKGYNVLFPMGFDSFGLPAENAAIQRRIHPKEWTYANIENMIRQIRSMGAMIDWERMAITSDPDYYRWTQWFFVKFFEQGLAYKKLSPVDFCPHCNTTLAREQVWGDDRHCERCGTPVIKKNLDQWFFRITDYADELLDFSAIEWPERVRVMQTNWIGRSEGAEVIFTTDKGGHELLIFTTRPDTLWGATFMVLAPEHPLVDVITTGAQRAAVVAYQAEAARASDIERGAADREKTGVFTGAYAINPVNGERVPIWVADYVMMSYGSGAIMAVPAHDERDFAFARKYGLEVRVVIQPEGEALDGAAMAEAYPGAGVMVNSAQFNGTPASEEKGRRNPAISAVIDWLQSQGKGKEAINYRLRDWLISRQRYWGAPIPMVTCPDCGIVAVPEDQLPVLLPDDIEFMPTGESPLKLHPTWRHTTCPQCGGPAERETDTMDTFMCSSWYQYRYLSPHDPDGPFDTAEGAYWLPVDQYTGGIEHATMHLLYTRFFTRAMRDCGVFAGLEAGVEPERFAAMTREPMTRLYNQGMILGEDGEKMSKSRGNVVDPDNLVARYGADVVRGYMMFAFKWDQGGPWDNQGIKGIVRFLNDVWALCTEPVPASLPDPAATVNTREEALLRRRVHQTIIKVTNDLENFNFNTALAALMELKNTMQSFWRTPVAHSEAWNEAVRTLLLLLAPFTPFVAEELWARTGGGYSIHQQAWPQADLEAAREDMITLVVQVNGKVRDRIDVPVGISEADAKARALASAKVQEALDETAPKRVVVVPGKLVNIVV
ncbi:MAG: leucine--tRNA ligase [Anaerolineae bacterium]|nr:leucine--tRNA ligase [Anaerolineae bacterium]